MPKKNDREYRSMKLMAVARAADQAEEEGGYIVEGYATTFDEPYLLFYDWDNNPIYEVIDRKALEGADMTDVIMQYDHAGRVFARTRNGTLQLTVDDKGLKVRADLGKTENARNMWEDIKAEMIVEMSWCFTIVEESWNKKTRTSTVLKVGKIYDVSAVSIPANPGTDISAARKRSLDGAIQAERAERLAETAKEAARQKKIRALMIRARIAAGK